MPTEQFAAHDDSITSDRLEYSSELTAALAGLGREWERYKTRSPISKKPIISEVGLQNLERLGQTLLGIIHKDTLELSQQIQCFLPIIVEAVSRVLAVLYAIKQPVVTLMQEIISLIPALDRAAAVTRYTTTAVGTKKTEESYSPDLFHEVLATWCKQYCEDAATLRQFYDALIHELAAFKLILFLLRGRSEQSLPNIFTYIDMHLSNVAYAVIAYVEQGQQVLHDTSGQFEISAISLNVHIEQLVDLVDFYYIQRVIAQLAETVCRFSVTYPELDKLGQHMALLTQIAGDEARPRDRRASSVSDFVREPKSPDEATATAKLLSEENLKYLADSMPVKSSVFCGWPLLFTASSKFPLKALGDDVRQLKQRANKYATSVAARARLCGMAKR